MTRVVVENREPEEIFLGLRSKGIWAERRQFEPGDYLLGNDMCIERKTVRDFLSSIYDGRLFNQIKRMRELYRRVILVVEGDLIGLDEREKKILYSAIARIVIGGISVVNTIDKDATVELISSLAEKRKEEGAQSIITRKKGRVEEKERILFILQGFPGIGPKLSEKLLIKFGSLKGIFNASYGELKSILGEKKARAFVDTLEKRFIREEGEKVMDLSL
ncbi:MAG: ERCC4 domain-containing protein [Candidatus Methanodesulfokora sp.]